jgi:heat shock protein HslJ
VSTVTDTVTPHHLVPGSQLSLTFTHDGISTSAGCNTMSAAATLDSGTLVLDGPMSSTEMACSAALMRQDQWWANLLSGQPHVDATAHSLVVSDGTTTVTLTNENDAVPDRSLTGTRWLVDGLVDGDSVSSVPAGGRPVTRFGPIDVRLVACNHFQANYHADASALIVGRWHMVGHPKPCPSSAASLSSAIMDVLTGRVVYLIDGDQLTITNQSHAVMFRASESG